jgi:hypothetical protein
VNSEELEVSLRTEFESYLKNVFAEMRQEISQLQEKAEAELENYKSQLDVVFKDALSRADQEERGVVDAGFKESVVEHLRQARDEGARITATAIAEAEDMQKQSAPSVGIKELHRAINDISTKLSQAEILKTLVHHAGQFTPRGAFFIIKNEHFVGWRTFGKEKGENDEAVREVFLPFSSDSILSESTRSLVTVESSAGTYSDDAALLSKLEFDGSPDRMFAIPLVVRGRAVAVLYADYGTQGAEVNVEGLETLVRIAGLTVEVLASAKSAAAPKESKKKPSKAFARESFASVEHEVKESPQPEFAAVPNYTAPIAESSYQPSFESDSFSQPAYQEERTEQYSSFDDYKSERVQEESPAYSPEEIQEETSSHSPESVPAPVQEAYPAYEEQAWSEATVEEIPEINADEYSAEIDADEYAPDFSAEAKTNDYSDDVSYQPVIESNAQVSNDFSASPTNEYQLDNSSSFETPKTESFESFSTPQAESYAPVREESFSSFETVNNQPETSYEAPVEAPPVVQQAPAPVKSRFSERNVDLPIEVSEDERRLHNDARRFARLLVSEIKLYNEQKVKEGREGNDLYDRLREAIDRSREMYDKRVQPAVAAKFDYFHYELVNTLAEGDEDRLGAGYPGAAV